MGSVLELELEQKRRYGALNAYFMLKAFSSEMSLRFKFVFYIPIELQFGCLVCVYC